MSDIFEFIAAMFGSNLIEIVAVFLGIANITLLIKRSIWNYPFGIMMVILYTKIFFDHQLYSDSMLQIYFLLIQCYGWWFWYQNRDVSGHVVVRRMKYTHFIGYMFLAGIFSFALGSTMSSYTDAAFPFWDSSIAALSIVAQFLLSRRYLENWIIWIIVDVLAIGLFYTKGLMPTSVLYCIFLVMASIGLRTWYAAYKTNSYVEQ